MAVFVSQNKYVGISRRFEELRDPSLFIQMCVQRDILVWCPERGVLVVSKSKQAASNADQTRHYTSRQFIKESYA